MIIDSIRTRLSLLPWESSGFIISWLQLKETLGGSLPVGKCKLILSDNQTSLDNVINERSGIIKIQDENPIPLQTNYGCEIPIFITSRQYYKNELELRFVVVKDPKFISEIRDLKYNNITELLTQLSSEYHDNNSLISSDIDNELPINQFGETDYELCTRYAASYKYDTVFGYSINEGLIIKDITGDTGKTIVSGNYLGFSTLIPPTLNYKKELTYEPEILCSSKKYISSYKLAGKVFLCSPGYDNLMVNSIRNKSIIENGLFGNYSVTGAFIPQDYSLGDIVKYADIREVDVAVKNKETYKKCIVSSNELFVGDGGDAVGPHGLKFEWTTELLCLESGPWSDKVE